MNLLKGEIYEVRVRTVSEDSGHIVEDRVRVEFGGPHGRMNAAAHMRGGVIGQAHRGMEVCGEEVVLLVRKEGRVKEIHGGVLRRRKHGRVEDVRRVRGDLWHHGGMPERSACSS